jgi:1,2-phenylacetyl-CoA epoxidase PaaB subunit
MRRMSKAKEPEWEITRIRGKSAVHVGYVHAPDEKSALAAAIKEYKIISFNDQMRLAARRR